MFYMIADISGGYKNTNEQDIVSSVDSNNIEDRPISTDNVRQTKLETSLGELGPDRY